MGVADVLSGKVAWHVECCDALDGLRALPECSIDALVTDPPAGIAFMGKEWDRFGGRGNNRAEQDRDAANRGPGAGGSQPFGYSGSAVVNPGQREAFVAFLSAVAAECLRVLKPGAYGLVWAIPRTSHWTATALEEAGFEIRDRIAHLFGQGFPKAKSCLKPAVEDWWLVRKPGRGVRPLGIDECRVSHGDDLSRYERSATSGFKNGGRWPANLVLSHHEDCRPVGTKRVPSNWREDKGELRGTIYGGGKGPSGPGGARGHKNADGLETVDVWECHPNCPVRLLDEQGGVRKSGAINGQHRREDTKNWRFLSGGERQADSGNASRFFFCPKSSSADRGEGNAHPTVKSTALMEWLVKLVSGVGDLVLDPFAGSGSTILAAIRCGRRAVGFEREAEYVAVAKARIVADAPLYNQEPAP